MKDPTVEELKLALQGRSVGMQEPHGRFAVLALLCEVDGALSLLFEQRADTLRGQPGETCFPGGRIEDGETPEVAALRETVEELGVPAESLRLLAPLDLVQDISNRVLYPFLAYLNAEGVSKLAPNPDEVKATFTIPLRHLREQEPYIYEAPVVVQIGEDFPYEKIGMDEGYRWRGGNVDVPVYSYQGHTVWGLTARMLRWLLHILEEAGL